MKNNVSELVSQIMKRSPEKVFLQVPEGLKTRLQEIEDRLKGEGIDSAASLEPCYGACDIKDSEAKILGCDLLVHVGHTKFCRDEEIDTLYFPWYYDVDPIPILSKNMDKLEDFDSIGLVTTANFLNVLGEAEDFLEDEGKEIFLGEGERTKNGQILGCDVSGAMKVEDDVDCYLYIGSGRFHPLILAVTTHKPVYIMDLERNDFYTPDFDEFEKQRAVSVENAKNCETFGILVSTKKGQANPGKAEKIKERLEEEGKDAWVFSMDEITPEKLKGIDVDCWVNTACPRIAVEHRTGFDETILNPEELYEAVKS